MHYALQVVQVALVQDLAVGASIAAGTVQHAHSVHSPWCGVAGHQLQASACILLY